MYSEIKNFQIILQNWKVLVPWAAVLTPYFVREKSIMTVAFFITRISSLSKGGTVRESEVPIANASSDFFRKCSLEQLGILLMRKVAIAYYDILLLWGINFSSKCHSGSNSALSKLEIKLISKGLIQTVSCTTWIFPNKSHCFL